MSNTSKGKAEKGSKKLMQQFAEKNDFLKDILNYNTINWISPKKCDNYVEYRLGQKGINEKLGIDNNDLSFWPKTGPQWDGIAILDEGTANEKILLVEAKAHKVEVKSGCTATSIDSIQMIRNEIDRMFDKDDKDKWFKKYYQIVNRYIFTEHLSKKYNVIMAFVYFANDEDFNTNIDAWKECIRKDNDLIHNALKENYKYLLDDAIKQIIVDVKENKSYEYKS